MIDDRAMKGPVILAAVYDKRNLKIQNWIKGEELEKNV